jgi:hypothetical protein
MRRFDPDTNVKRKPDSSLQFDHGTSTRKQRSRKSIRVAAAQAEVNAAVAKLQKTMAEISCSQTDGSKYTSCGSLDFHSCASGTGEMQNAPSDLDCANLQKCGSSESDVPLVLNRIVSSSSSLTKLSYAGATIRNLRSPSSHASIVESGRGSPSYLPDIPPHTTTTICSSDDEVQKPRSIAYEKKENTGRMHSFLESEDESDDQCTTITPGLVVRENSSIATAVTALNMRDIGSCSDKEDHLASKSFSDDEIAGDTGVEESKVLPKFKIKM